MRAPCGTHAAYSWHIKYGETPCDACREANRDYMRAYRRRKLREADPWLAAVYEEAGL